MFPASHCVFVNVRAGYPVANPLVAYVIGVFAVAFEPSTLSTHVVSVVPFEGLTPVPAGSFASSHRAQPEIEVGLNAPPKNTSDILMRGRVVC